MMTFNRIINFGIGMSQIVRGTSMSFRSGAHLFKMQIQQVGSGLTRVAAYSSFVFFFANKSVL